MIFPLCSPYHPLFGDKNCETYSLIYFYDIPRFTYERTIDLGGFSSSTFTDIYTYRTIYDTLNYQTVGFKFHSPNLVGEAYTERINIEEDYAFGFIGRYKWFSGLALKGTVYPDEERAYFVNFVYGNLSIGGGWDGGYSFGGSFGDKIFLRGLYYSSYDTVFGGGLGYRGDNLAISLLGGYGFLADFLLIISDFQISGEYNLTKKLNDALIMLKYGDFAGLSLIYGKRPWGRFGYIDNPEIQGFIGFKNPLFSAYIKGVYVFQRVVYRVASGVQLNFLRFKEIAEFKPILDTYYEDNGNLWINAGGEVVFYKDLHIGAFYDYWKNSQTIRVSVLWRLWD